MAEVQYITLNQVMKVTENSIVNILCVMSVCSSIMVRVRLIPCRRPIPGTGYYRRLRV